MAGPGALEFEEKGGELVATAPSGMGLYLYTVESFDDVHLRLEYRALPIATLFSPFRRVGRC